MFEQVKALLVEKLNIDADTVTPEAELEKDLGLNSLDVYDLVVSCDEVFNVEIEDETARSFLTVGDIVSYLEQNVQ